MDPTLRTLRDQLTEEGRAYYAKEMRARDEEKARLKKERVDASKASPSFWTRYKAAAVPESNERFTRELIRLGMDPTLRTLRDQLTEEGRAYYAKEMRARDEEKARLKKERVDASKASPSFWTRYKAAAVKDTIGR
eukprot:scaffold19067_cov75-Phaeocystis_antarctica.AAC.1